MGLFDIEESKGLTQESFKKIGCKLYTIPYVHELDTQYPPQHPRVEYYNNFLIHIDGSPFLISFFKLYNEDSYKIDFEQKTIQIVTRVGNPYDYAWLEGDSYESVAYTLYKLCRQFDEGLKSEFQLSLLMNLIESEVERVNKNGYISVCVHND